MNGRLVNSVSTTGSGGRSSDFKHDVGAETTVTADASSVPHSASAIDVLPLHTSSSGRRKRDKAYGYPLLQPAATTPKFLRTPHIHTGYRPYFTAPMCARSLFMIHNETINVWTHLLGALYFAYCAYWVLFAYEALPAEDEPGAVPGATATATATTATSLSLVDKGAFGAWLLCAQLCMLCSAAFHLFGAIDEAWNRMLYRLDILGIIVLIAGSYGLGLYYGFHCHLVVGGTYFAVLLAMLGGAAYLTVSPAWQRPEHVKHRLAAFVSSVLYSLLPVTHWARGSSSAIFWTFLDRIILVLLFYALGFFVYATHIPERWAPGRFDNFCHSHQWWHVFVFIASVTFFDGMVEFSTWRLKAPCDEFPY